jgi:hypothetical protein
MRIGIGRLVGDRRAIGSFGLGRTARLLQRVAVLDPDRRIIGGALERDAVKPGRVLPLPGRPGLVGAGDDRRAVASQPKARHRHAQFKHEFGDHSSCKTGQRRHDRFTRWRQGRTTV